MTVGSRCPGLGLVDNLLHGDSLGPCALIIFLPGMSECQCAAWTFSSYVEAMRQSPHAEDGRTGTWSPELLPSGPHIS